MITSVQAHILSIGRAHSVNKIIEEFLSLLWYSRETQTTSFYRMYGNAITIRSAKMVATPFVLHICWPEKMIKP
jgi:hypothetical protein